MEKCLTEEWRRFLDTFKHFWLMCGSLKSEEHLQHLLSEGYSYHDALDATTVQFVIPPP